MSSGGGHRAQVDPDFARVMSKARRRAKWHRRLHWRHRMRQHPVYLRWYRSGVGVVGVLLIMAAALTGPLPGPGGIPLFLLGMAVLASEFLWAKRLHAWAKLQIHRYQELPLRVRRIFWAIVVVLILLAWWVILIFMGVPDWMPDIFRQVLENLPGV